MNQDKIFKQHCKTQADVIAAIMMSEFGGDIQEEIYGFLVGDKALGEYNVLRDDVVDSLTKCTLVYVPPVAENVWLYRNPETGKDEVHPNIVIHDDVNLEALSTTILVDGKAKRASNRFSLDNRNYLEDDVWAAVEEAVNRAKLMGFIS